MLLHHVEHVYHIQCCLLEDLFYILEMSTPRWYILLIPNRLLQTDNIGCDTRVEDLFDILEMSTLRWYILLIPNRLLQTVLID